MIFLMFAWVVLGGCSFLIGNAILTLLKPDNAFVRHYDRFFVSVWLGIAIIAPILLALSILTPLKPIVAAAVFGGALGLSLLHRASWNYVQESFSEVTATAIVGTMFTALGVAAYASRIITWYDSGLYHEQVIKWLAEFGSVPGLALIHERFGFSSSWFALSAPFDHGLLSGRIYSVTGGFVLFMMLHSFAVNFTRIVGKYAEEEDVFLELSFLIAIPVILFWGMAVSPSPDMPVTVLTIVIAWIMLKIQRNSSNNACSIDGCMNIRLLPFILSLFAVTIKLSAFPLVVFSGYFYLFSGKFFSRKSAMTACTGFFFLIPYMAVNAITSGYLLFPSSLLRIDLPWTMEIESVKNLEKVVQAWSRWGGRPTPTWGNDFNWIMPWLGAEKMCALLVLLSTVSAAIIIFSPARLRLANKYVIAIASTGIAFMMYKAPTWRFGLGYLVILPSLLAMSQMANLTNLMEPMRKWVNQATLGLLIALLLVVHLLYIPLPHYKLVVKSIQEGRLETDDNPYVNWLLPPMAVNMYFKMPDSEQQTITCERLYYISENTDGLTYYRGKDEEQCWDSPLPCAPGVLKRVQLRKPEMGLVGGFIRESRL